MAGGCDVTWQPSCKAVERSGGGLVTGDAPHYLFAVAVIKVFWHYCRQFWGVWLASRLGGTVFEVKE